ncbi:MAG: hypothetical protein RLZZ299_2477, partial [Pseudomonadota bacterium]
AALGVAAPVGLYAAVATTGRRWAAGGAWHALRASGVSPGAVAADAALLAVAVAVPWSVAEHLAIPRARARLADSAVTLAVPADGRAVAFGPAWLAREGRAVRILLAPDDAGWTRLAASRGTVTPRPRGVALALEDVVIDRADGVVLRAARAHGAWHPPVRRGAGERTTGTWRPRDDHERWVVAKRTLVPVSACGWAPAALAAGVRARAPALLAAVACLGAGWAVVRGLDGAVRAGALGVPGAGAVLLGVAGIAACVGVRVLERR